MKERRNAGYLWSRILPSVFSLRMRRSAARRFQPNCFVVDHTQRLRHVDSLDFGDFPHEVWGPLVHIGV